MKTLNQLLIMAYYNYYNYIHCNYLVYVHMGMCFVSSKELV